MSALTLGNLKIFVAEHLRLGADLTAISAGELARMGRALQLGLHDFYFPENRPGFIWDFLKIGDTFNTVVGTSSYTPFNTDFAGMRGHPTFFGTTPQEWGIEVQVDQRYYDIVQGEGTTQTGRPKIAIISPVAPFVPATGQQWKLELQPIPDAVYAIRFTFVVDPGVPANNADYILMGPECMNAVIAACNRAADREYGRDDAVSNRNFITAMEAAMGRHNVINNRGSQNLGSMGRFNRKRGWPESGKVVDIPTITYY